MEATKRVATQLDEVIIFRSTGPWSRRWLEKDYPSKNFHVKGKKLRLGPACRTGAVRRDLQQGNRAAAVQARSRAGLDSASLLQRSRVETPTPISRATDSTVALSGGRTLRLKLRD